MNTIAQTTSVEDRVKRIVARVAGSPVEAVSLDSTWRSLAIDSLDLFDLLVALEKEFDIEIPDEHAIGFYSVKDVVRFLAARY